MSVNDAHDNQIQLIWEKVRYRTFTKWPYKKNANCLPAIMAQAGWFCTGVDGSDASAMCAFCFKELNGWEPTDDPWEEHLKHSADCPFVKLGKTEQNFTARDFCNIIEARLLIMLERQHKENISNLEKLRDKVYDFVNERAQWKNEESKN